MSTSSQKLSFVKGSTEPELWEISLGSFVKQQAVRYGDRPAIIVPWQSTRVSYRQLADRTQTVARALVNAGLGPGDCVGVMGGNRFEYLEAALGAARVGCPVVVLNNTYTAHELKRAIHKSGCKFLFIAAHIGPRKMHDHITLAREPAELEAERTELTGIVTFDEASVAGDGVPVQSYTSFMGSSTSGVSLSRLEEIEQSISPQDVINLQFTSGTTGEPKAAMLTSVNVVNNGRFVGDALRLTPDDVVCCPPPLFHCFGLVLGFLACYTHGSSIVFASDSFDAGKVIQAINDERATVLLGVPTMFVAELEVIAKTGTLPKSLRCGLSAGSAMPAALAKELNAKMGLEKIIIAYGMTETSPVSFITAFEDSLHRRLNSIGRMIPHTMGKVIDKEGNVVPRGQRGELLTTGFVLQKGYLNNPKKTEEVMKRDENGVLWMHTGDEVYIDDDGYAYITGRIKDIIIRGGENIFPREIEERLLEHPSITESCIVGLKDHKYGEVVGAFLRQSSQEDPALSHDEVREWVTDKLGRHKAPKHVFWVGDEGAVTDYPKTGSGKYQKHILRDIGDKLVKQNTVRARL